MNSKTWGTAPTQESMKRAHRVRRFRRGNAEHGRAYLGRKAKPWRASNNTAKVAAA